jgi:hypothetical protein
MEEYVREANKTLDSLAEGVQMLIKKKGPPGTTLRLLEQCHHLESISIQNEQYLIAYLTSKVGFLLPRIRLATPAERKIHLIFLNDFLRSLKRSLRHATKKRRGRIETEKFQKLNELIRGKYAVERGQV